jgi:hypothetical protein
MFGLQGMTTAVLVCGNTVFIILVGKNVDP